MMESSASPRPGELGAVGRAKESVCRWETPSRQAKAPVGLPEARTTRCCPAPSCWANRLRGRRAGGKTGDGEDGQHGPDYSQAHGVLLDLCQFIARSRQSGCCVAAMSPVIARCSSATSARVSWSRSMMVPGTAVACCLRAAPASVRVMARARSFPWMRLRVTNPASSSRRRMGERVAGSCRRLR